jgi:hypothetical protein
VGGNPLKYVDFYGLDPFLASRPTRAGQRHMFVVYGADADGNGGTIRSFGPLGNGPGVLPGNLGEMAVSSSTYQTDLDFWTNKPSELRYTRIPATDLEVECAANSFPYNKYLYTLPPVYSFLPLSGHAVINSNTAAQAIANRAAQSPVTRPNGNHPGAENANFIEFSP